MPSQLECYKGCLLWAARDWVARTQSLRTVLAGSKVQGFGVRLGWVHPLLHAVPGAAQLPPESTTRHRREAARTAHLTQVSKQRPSDGYS